MNAVNFLLGLVIVMIILIIAHAIYTAVRGNQASVPEGDKYDQAWQETLAKCQLQDLTRMPRVLPYTLESNIYSNNPAQ